MKKRLYGYQKWYDKDYSHQSLTSAVKTKKNCLAFKHILFNQTKGRLEVIDIGLLV